MATQTHREKSEESAWEVLWQLVSFLLTVVFIAGLVLSALYGLSVEDVADKIDALLFTVLCLFGVICFFTLNILEELEKKTMPARTSANSTEKDARSRALIEVGEGFLVVDSPETGRRYGIAFDREGEKEVVNITELEKDDPPNS